MERDQVTMFLQSLRGNQALIVLAYLAVRRALTIEELEGMTGLHNDTVRAAVRGLAAKGFLHKQTGEHGRQTWLPMADTFFGALLGQNPKTSDSGSSSSRVVTNSLPLQEEQEERTESENFGLCRRACDEVGIREPKRSQIAQLEHVTPEFIRAHVAQVKSEGFPIGTAIYRILNNWDVPEVVHVDDASASAAYCPKCWRVDCICDDGEESPRGYQPLTLDDLRKAGRRINFGVCSVCDGQGEIISTAKADYCIDHYNDYRYQTLGFDRRNT